MTQQIQILWDEYKHRHSHCWALVFKLTAGVVTLSCVPYACGDQLIFRLGFWVGAPSFLAVALAGAGFRLLERELSLFAKIKREYRKLQQEETSIKHGEKSRFNRWILSYAGAVFALTVVNLVFCYSYIRAVVS